MTVRVLSVSQRRRLQQTAVHKLIAVAQCRLAAVNVYYLQCVYSCWGTLFSSIDVSCHTVVSGVLVWLSMKEC
jgi:hypothetical protein